MSEKENIITNNYLTVDSLTTLKQLKEVKENMAFVKDEKALYEKTDNGWQKKEQANITLYDLNRALIQSLPELTIAEKEEGKKLIRTYIHNNIEDDYYTLLCHELKYFTVFVNDAESEESAEDVILECIECLGFIKSIALTEDQSAIEVWISTNDTDSYVMYLFDYGRGIVPCKIN